jgi:hypothetical protein
MRTDIIVLSYLHIFVLSACSQSDTINPTSNDKKTDKVLKTDSIKLINPVFIIEKATVLKDRFPAPEDFVRKEVEKGGFAHYLRNLKLKPHNALVEFYDGREKANRNVYLAVLDQEIGNQDLHQCADAIMNLYARHHYENKRYDKIHFNFTNGWRCDFKKYADGYRINFNGNKTSWIKKKEASYSLKTFEEYLIWIYKFCGTASLEKELNKVEDFSDIQIGDVLIKGGFPGHAVLVIDLIENSEGNKKFLLAQSYMPAQQMQILQNPMNEDKDNPWYDLSALQANTIKTPEWIFTKDQLMRFSGQ